MNQEILNKLKHALELSPDEHDGSYELVRTIVSAYRDVDEAVLDYHDLNAIYLMCIGTWRHSYDKKHEAVHATHLSEIRKQELDHLIDDLRRRAETGAYKNQEKVVSGTGHIGMFGTGFYSFQNKTDPKSVRAFIKMCIDLLDMTDDEDMFQRAALVLTKSFHGMQAAAASVVLHCLKPLTFPVINSNVGSEDIFAALGIELKSRGKLETYVDNCRKIKAFRDTNFSFKNYRILDMAAWELSSDPIRRIISQYKASFATWIPQEIYKWRAVQCFQEHWMPERANFAEMLKEALAQASNLMDTNYSFPRKMITFFAEQEPDTVRSMFQQLLDPEADVIEQIQNFKQNADALLSRYQLKESMKQHYQGDRTICTYLFFARPNQHFLYQYGKLKAFLAETGLSATCKMGDIQNVLTYQEVANKVLACVQQDSELLNMFETKRAEFGSEYYPDAEHHLLADDIIYFGSQLYKSDYWPSLAEYDPEISTEQWLELLVDRTICTAENLQILKAIQQVGGEATCKQLSLKLGDTSAHYNGSMVQLARRVQEKTGCPLVQNENNDQKWWPILFVGRTALQDQPGTYSWKLRDELAEALKLLPQKEVNNPMSFAKNTILYGPPGTGKTYQTVNYAVAIIEGKSLEEVQVENHEEVLKRYRQYRQNGRIEFTTFHQSFGYEDFIEGIRPIFAEDREEDSGDISYEITDGVFKKFCETAQPPAVDPNQNPYGFSESPTIWKVSFLEIEKESEIEADVETIFSIASKYKLNWDNEHFVASNHKMVLDIQRTARKNMLSYEKKVSDIVRGKKLIVAHAQVKSALQDLLKKFKYYRLSLYTFSMSSLMEVMLGGNFNEEYVSGIKDEIRQMSEAYRDLFARCSVYLENLSSSSIEKNFLAGIGTAGKAVGTLIGNIPGIKEGPVDEFLVDQGSRMKKSAHSMQAQSIKEFAEISNPQTGVFIDRLEDVIRIFNHTDQICFDRENIYLM